MSGGTETPSADGATPRPGHGLNISRNKICVGELTTLGIWTKIFDENSLVSRVRNVDCLLYTYCSCLNNGVKFGV